MTVSLTQDTDKGPCGGSSGVLSSGQHTLKEPSNGQNDPLMVGLYGYTTVAVTLDACGTLSLSPARASPCTPAGRTDVSSQCSGGQSDEIHLVVVSPHSGDSCRSCGHWGKA